MNDSQFNSSSKRRQSGVSLIEVLVVLVILVTGILTIIRLFPSGFFSIQSTGNAAVGDSLGVAAISASAQNSANFPEAILPANTSTTPANLLPFATQAAAATAANYDLDDPNNLDQFRLVSNEEISVPTASNGHSVYVVKYGPVVMPADPAVSAAQFSNYFTVNSPNWTPLAGNSTLATVLGSNDLAQDTLVPGQERFLVDLTNKMIAVPYAPYTPYGTPFPVGNGAMVYPANSYAQKMVVMITCNDGKTYTKYLHIPAATPRDTSNPYAPLDVGNPQAYLPDTYSATGNYQGGWFDPMMQYGDPSGPSGTSPPSNVLWLSAALYRVYNGVVTNGSYSNDPYEFKLLAANFGTANPGSVEFNPKAAIGLGAQARKAKVSYLTSSWSILHEDYDIPSLTGSGSTDVIRTSVPNLKLAGSANPDNSINPGIAGSSDSVIIMDLGTGKIIAPAIPSTDPTNPDAPINNEDLNGSNPGPSNNLINISFSTGRLTFGSNAFGDNSGTNGSGTAPAHRIRVFYTADLNWTVAVQKAPSYFGELATTPAQTATGTTALAADQFAYDKADAFVYFARCNAGKTVEIDGTYTLGGTTKSFSDTVSIDPVLNAVGDTAVRVNLYDGNKVQYPVPQNATVTFAAVRGLSARAVVAWKERNQWKSHSVDAVLNRTP